MLFVNKRMKGSSTLSIWIYPICNMVGVIFTNIMGCSIGELVKARCGQLGIVVNNLLLNVTSVVQIHPFQRFFRELTAIFNYQLYLHKRLIKFFINSPLFYGAVD